MKQLTIFTLLLLPVLVSYSQKSKTSLERENLKGRISTVDYNSYVQEPAMERQLRIRRTSFYSKNGDWLKTLYYDDRGLNVTDSIVPRQKGNSKPAKGDKKYRKGDTLVNEYRVNSLQVVNKTVFWKNGQKKAYSSFSYTDKGVLDFGQVSDFDENGFLLAESFFFEDSSRNHKSLYRNNEKGFPVASEDYDADGKLDKKVTYDYEFDQMGNMTFKAATLEVFHKTGSYIEYETEYWYYKYWD